MTGTPTPPEGGSEAVPDDGSEIVPDDGSRTLVADGGETAMADDGLEIRRATLADAEGVRAMTESIWEDRGGDYLHRVYEDWLEDEDDDRTKTFLAEADGEVAGIVQATMLSDDEAWFQGMRVHPDYRRRGVSLRLNDASFSWARERGATVGRIMVFSWNLRALSAARAGGFEPVTEFRWASPTPDADADGPLAVSNDPAAAWRYWTECDAREHLRGLALDPDETWAVSELTRADLQRLADETAVFAVRGDDGLAGAGCRVRAYERTNDDGERISRAEYAVGAWDSVEAARTLFAAVARDAADIGADRTRVLVPETVEVVSDAAVAGAEISDEPDFVLGVDLTDR